jgi:glycosyltransferase involved in cell wall biosynthesis
MAKPTQTTTPLRICVVSHFAYGAMTGGSSGHIGGVERQTSLLARWLAARGHDVSLITWDEGQEETIEIDGVRLLKLCRREDGFPGIRFLHPRWTSLLGALRRADADVYYQNCGECVTGQVALWCHQRRVGFVFSAAANADCDKHLPHLSTIRERMFHRLGLRLANCVIVQTRTQQHMLSRNFNREAIVLPMPCPSPDPSERAVFESTGSRRVLWIGRICEPKRPDRLVDLAATCPDLHFDLIGPADDTAYSRGILEQVRRVANVTVHGPVSRQQLARFYRHAACLCCTSDHEGFPNTFLEAWSYGLPVVSTFDPDDLIAHRQLGAAVRDVRDLAGAIRDLVGTPDRWKVASSNSNTYYLSTHTPDRAMPLFERVILEAATLARDHRPRTQNGGRRYRMKACQ